MLDPRDGNARWVTTFFYGLVPGFRIAVDEEWCRAIQDSRLYLMVE